MQLDDTLIEAMHLAGFEVAVETNGTLPLPDGLDWVCVSPKGTGKVVVTHCDEVKLVYPQADCPPEHCVGIAAEYYYLSPMDDWRGRKERTHESAVGGCGEEFKHLNTQMALNYSLKHPQWRLTMQLHKLLGID